MENKKPEQLRMGPILMISISSLMIFVSLAEDVLHYEAFSALDPILGNKIMTDTSQIGDQIFAVITFYGNALVIIGGTIMVGLWLLKRKRRDQLIFLDTVVGGAALQNIFLKQLFARPRPDYPQAYMTAPGFSFPSGHAMISIAFYGAIAYLACSYLKQFRAKLLVSMSALVISGLIGFSRLYLGVHYISDVLAGWAAGMTWLAVCIFVDQLHLWKAENQKRLET